MPSKLCPHSLVPTADAKRWVEAGCPLVKMVNDFGAVNEYLAINPRLIVIGRGYTSLTLLEQYQTGDAPEEAARKFVEEQTSRYYHTNPQVKIWEGHNEPSFGGPDDPGAVAKTAWYGHYEAERLRRLANLGLRGVVGNFSTGYPEINKNDLRMWEAFMPAVEAAKRHNGLIGMHEYAAPWLWWYTGDYQTSNCPGGPNPPRFPGGELGDMGWLTLRYRQVYRYALKPRGLDGVPLVITECGNDRAGGGCPGMTITGAWRDMIGYWEKWDGSADPIDYWRGSERDPERYYAEQFMWYDGELKKDPYVIGATVFTFGSNDPTWDHYNVAGTRFTAILADYIRKAQSEAPVVTPVEATQPATPTPLHLPPSEGERRRYAGHVEVIPRRGDPRVQYARLYVLMPAGLADPTWVSAAAVAVWAKRRVTFGGSADDAGIGNLNSRTVVAVNPETWGTQPPLHEWFALNYPGVNFTAVHATSPGDLVRLLTTVAMPKPTAPPATLPAPAVGGPRAQYPRTYVLLSPKMTDANWVAAAANATWTSRRYTIGGSADDAGIGDLDIRRVIALNPDDWGEDMPAWYARYYPGVEYQGVRVNSVAQVAGVLAQFG